VGPKLSWLLAADEPIAVPSLLVRGAFSPPLFHYSRLILRSSRFLDYNHRHTPEQESRRTIQHARDLPL